MSDNSREHDIVREDGYKKRCYCEKCVKQFDHWCDVKKHEGKALCKKKSVTICEIVCERTDQKTYFYGHKKEFEGKWESTRAHPEKCRDRKDGGNDDYESGKHDEYNENGYKKRCRCQKCKRQYDEWCKDKQEKGKTICKRKCYTIVEYVCEKTDVYTHKWGLKKKYESNWEITKPFEPPRRYRNDDCDDENSGRKSRDEDRSERKSRDSDKSGRKSRDDDNSRKEKRRSKDCEDCDRN